MQPSELFENNKKLVFFVAKKLRNNYPRENMPLEFEDMIQVGFIGLWKACNNFKPELGFKFSTYAVTIILGEVTKELRDNNGLIRVSRKCKIIWKKLLKRVDYGAEVPTVEEIMKEFKCSRKHAITVTELFNLRIVSDSTPLMKSSDGKYEYYLSQIIGDENANFEKEFMEKENLREIFSLLNEKEKFVLEKTLEEHTQTEIAEMLGVTQAHVSRIYRRSLTKIRKHYGVSKNENQPQFS